MSPNERINKILCQERPDRLPVMLGPTNEFVCHYYDITPEEYCSNAGACSTAFIRLFRDFGVDSAVIAPGYIFYGCGPEMGVDWQFADGYFPGFRKGPIDSEKDIDKIIVPKEPLGYFKNYLEALYRVRNELKDQYHCVANILGPFGIACFLRGVENTLLDTMMNPNFFNAYMQKSTDLCIFFGKKIIETGIPNTILNEIFLTPQMMRPDMYHKMVRPFDEKAQANLGEKNTPNVMGSFMGKYNDKASQDGGKLLYNSFFGLDITIETLENAIEFNLPGRPFPLCISGQIFDEWETGNILSFFKEALNFLVQKKGFYPAINIASMMAHSKKDAADKAEKLNSIIGFVQSYKL